MDFVNSDIWQQLFVRDSAQIAWWAEVVRSILRLVVALAGGLGSVPVLVWLERRLLGWFQGRLGPNRVGPQGLLQPLADALKLMMKEDITPTNVDRVLYYIAPVVALVPVVMSLTVLPWNLSRDWGAVAPRLDAGVLFLLGIASIEVYGVILAGWSSNNKYSLLGGLRASSQVISYELGMGLTVIAILVMSATLSLPGIVGHQAVFESVPVEGTGYTILTQTPASGFWNWHVFEKLPFGLIAAGIFMISMLAETNRAPFDLPEAETELVAGFHTEYTSFKFAMFFMGEYANMLVVSWWCVTLFFGGPLAPWGPLGQLPAAFAGFLPVALVNAINHVVIEPAWLVAKIYGLIFFFIWVRATLPRLRYDMLMKLGWKALLPVALVNVSLIAVSTYLQRTVLGPFFGHMVAVALGAALALILGYQRLARYRTERAAAGTREIALAGLTPVNRPTVVTPTAPSLGE
jgi:NADH-quinone oxidoreductase subunit H